MSDIEEIRRRLRESIKHCGINQKEIAKAVGISQATVSDYMNKEKLPSIDTLADICKVIDVSPAYIAFPTIFDAGFFL